MPHHRRPSADARAGLWQLAEHNMSRRLISVAGFLLAGLACGVAGAADSAPAAIDSHQVGWWKFEETTGTSAADSAKPARNGTLEGGLAFDKASVPGRVGKAIQFDGKGSVRIDGFKGILGDKPRSVSAWVKTTTPGGELVSWGVSDGGKMFIVSFIRNRVGVTPKGGYLYMKQGVHDDAWHHVAVVVHEASPPNLHDHVKLYLDGEPAEIDDIGLLDLWPIDTGEKQDVTIGRRFKGAIDELRIYDCPLSNEQVKALYKQETAAPAKP